MQSKTSAKPSAASDYGSLKRGVFAVLSNEERNDILESSTLRILPRGAHLVRTQAPADSFYIVLEGRLEVSRSSAQGKSVILNHIGEGDVIGEVSALGGVPRTADVICLEKCFVAEISVDVFRAKLAAFPSFAAFIMKSLAQRLSRSTYQLFDLATEDVPSRVLQTLRSMGAQASNLREEYYLVRERPTHAELARMVGTSREVVGRALTLLEKAGEIQQDGKQIFIKLTQ